MFPARCNVAVASRTRAVDTVCACKVMRWTTRKLMCATRGRRCCAGAAGGRWRGRGAQAPTRPQQQRDGAWGRGGRWGSGTWGRGVCWGGRASQWHCCFTHVTYQVSCVAAEVLVLLCLGFCWTALEATGTTLHNVSQAGMGWQHSRTLLSVSTSDSLPCNTAGCHLHCSGASAAQVGC